MKKWLVITTLILVAAIFLPSCGEDTGDNEEPMIVGKVIDAMNLSPIAQAKIVLFYKSVTTQQWIINDSMFTGNDGSYKFFVQVNRSYKVEAIANGFKVNKAVDITPENYYAVVDFILAPTSVDIPIGSVSGRVVDKNKKPVAGAIVSISGGIHTNGYFASTTTDEKGAFGIGIIPIISPNNGDTIPYFTLKATKSGYRFTITDSIKIYENQTTGNVQLILLPMGNLNPVWSEDFEQSASVNRWTATGFWHRQPNATIRNAAYPKHVKLGPDDNTNGFIPHAYQGNYSFWYGVDNPSNYPNLADSTSIGNFLGMKAPYDDSLSGGTSQQANSGYLRSDTINLAGLSEASLNFYSWWEIEGVNPNANGYDWMTVSVWDLSQANPTFFNIIRLNPWTDPITSEERAPLAYTSSGFNKKPLWVNYDVDLTRWAGKKIQIQFTFQTNDNLYNGFRGWFIDDLKIFPVKGELGLSPISIFKKQPSRR